METVVGGVHMKMEKSNKLKRKKEKKSESEKRPRGREEKGGRLKSRGRDQKSVAEKVKRG